MEDGPGSWLEMVEDGYPYRRPLSYTLPDILRKMDLPMLRKLVKARVFNH